MRPIATWRFAGATRSLVKPSATGNTPPEPMPARIRDANNSGNDVDKRAEDARHTEQHQAHDHQPRLAEQVGRRPQHRLHDRKGEGKHRRETRSGGDADAEIVGNMRQHRIERAGRQTGSEVRERDDIDGRRQALLLRPQCCLQHQRATFFSGFLSGLLARFLVSASNAISVRSNPSNSRSGTILGPSDGA